MSSHQTVPPAAPARVSKTREKVFDGCGIKRRAVATTRPQTDPAARIGRRPRKENGRGPTRVSAAKAPRITPVERALNRLERRIRDTTTCKRLTGSGSGSRRGGNRGMLPAPRAVGGNRGGGASRARASVANGISSAAVIETIVVPQRYDPFATAKYVRRHPHRPVVRYHAR
jgi:hypothetical protein